MATEKTRTVCLKEIAHELGLRRYDADRKLKIFQAGRAGTPIKMRKGDFDRLTEGNSRCPAQR